MTPRGRRLLSDAEIEVWIKVAHTVAPRPGAVLPARKPAAVPVAPPVPQPEAPVRHAVLPPYVPPVAQPRPAKLPLAPFEKRYRQKVTHGRIEIEGVIDLHGMTQAVAHGALEGFLRAAQSGGARLVLVVTGKGRARIGADRAEAHEPGVLRRAVPQWLRDAGLRRVVLGFEEAGVPHGGMGALYVRLRKSEA